eukprot:CFRG3279T1
MSASPNLSFTCEEGNGYQDFLEIQQTISKIQNARTVDEATKSCEETVQRIVGPCSAAIYLTKQHACDTSIDCQPTYRFYRAGQKNRYSFDENGKLLNDINSMHIHFLDCLETLLLSKGVQVGVCQISFYTAVNMEEEVQQEKFSKCAMLATWLVLSATTKPDANMCTKLTDLLCLMSDEKFLEKDLICKNADQIRSSCEADALVIFSHNEGRIIHLAGNVTCSMLAELDRNCLHSKTYDENCGNGLEMVSRSLKVYNAAFPNVLSYMAMSCITYSIVLFKITDSPKAVKVNDYVWSTVVLEFCENLTALIKRRAMNLSKDVASITDAAVIHDGLQQAFMTFSTQLGHTMSVISQQLRNLTPTNEALLTNNPCTRTLYRAQGEYMRLLNTCIQEIEDNAVNIGRDELNDESNSDLLSAHLKASDIFASESSESSEHKIDIRRLERIALRINSSLVSLCEYAAETAKFELNVRNLVAIQDSSFHGKDEPFKCDRRKLYLLLHHLLKESLAIAASTCSIHIAAREFQCSILDNLNLAEITIATNIGLYVSPGIISAMQERVDSLGSLVRDVKSLVSVNKSFYRSKHLLVHILLPEYRGTMTHV